MKEIEIEGKTVTIAVESGLTELGLQRDEVEVHVIEEGSAGFLGLGSKPARVRIREKRWSAGPAAAQPVQEEKPAAREPADKPEKKAPRRHPERHREQRPRAAEDRGAPQRRPGTGPRRHKSGGEPRRSSRADEPQHTEEERSKACETAESVLKEILMLAGLNDARVKTAWDKQQGRVQAEVETTDAGLLIGKGGRTLEALQFLVTVIVGRKSGKPTAIQVETQGYWKRIEGKILAEADRALGEVKRTGSSFRFEPMEPALRRLIHRRFVNHPDVETSSEGEGPWRKVVIRPRRKR